MNDFKAILWDNDGTLVNTEPYYFKSTEQVLKEVGIEIDEQWYKDQHLKSGVHSLQLAMDAGATDEDISRIRDRRNKYYADYIENGVIVMPGIEDALKSLHGKVKMGVVTDAYRVHFDRIMDLTGLEKYFDFTITSTESGHHKPNPEPYMKGVELTGLEAKDCLAIEDTERGLTSAKRAGLTCFVIPNSLTMHADYSLADRVFNNVTELVDYLL